MSRKPKTSTPSKFVDESYKIRIDTALENFKTSSETEYRFPSNLNNTERRYVHEVCAKMGLASKSRGKGESRYLTVSRKVVSKARNQQSGAPKLLMGDAAKEELARYLQAYPPNEDEAHRVRTAKFQEEMGSNYEPLSHQPQHTGLAPLPVIDVPTSLDYSQYFTKVQNSRKELPIWKRRDDILNAIDFCDVLVLSSPTGTGKSTQVPQYLVEMESLNNNIICTQPRRLSATALAQRVASENGSGDAGKLVGYSVRLERCRGPETRLLYCTTGVLLRELAHSKTALGKVTHLIIDEVHERDVNSDFLLMIVRELLLQQQQTQQCHKKKLKLILMSATLQVDMFVSYFRNSQYPLTCCSIEIPGKMFEVSQLYLEDILVRNDFVSRMISRNKQISNVLESLKAQQLEDHDNTNDDNETTLAPSLECVLCSKQFSSPLELGQHAAFCVGRTDEAPSFWQSEWEEANDDDEEVEEEDIILIKQPQPVSTPSQEPQQPPRPPDGGLSLLDQYQYFRQLTGLDDTSLDKDMVVNILEQIEGARDDLGRLSGSGGKKKKRGGKPPKKGSVLIFLAGWDDISRMIDELENHPRFGDQSQYKLLPLHSGVTASAQRMVFARTPDTIRKIICATNIAETSVTIDDVLYVIDAGTSKTKRYDPYTKVSSLTVGMIAKANAIQRSGRAGRCQPGVCFKLYSKVRYDSLLTEEAPEMQRTSLEELCLQTCVLLERKSKLFSSKLTSVRDFLARAPDPPNDIAIRNALILLYELGAIDKREKLTALGRELSRLPLGPRLGRMVLIGSFLGVQDIALTLSAFSSVGKDPFVIPLTSHDQKKFATARGLLTGGINSDQYAVFRAFEEWKLSGRQACSKYYLSSSVMSTVSKTRNQIAKQISSHLTRSIILTDLLANISALTIIEILSSIGTFPNVAIRHPGVRKMLSGGEKNIITHKTSVVNVSASKSSHVWVVFNEMTRGKQTCSIRGCTEVLPIYIGMFQGEYTVEIIPGDEEVEEVVSLHLSDWIELQLDSQEVAINLGVLRARFEKAFLHSVEKSDHGFSEVDIATVGAVVRLCEAEKTGLVSNIQPSRGSARGVGGRGRGNGRGRGRGRGRGHSVPGATVVSKKGGRGRGRGRGGAAGSKRGGGARGTGKPHQSKQKKTAK